MKAFFFSLFDFSLDNYDIVQIFRSDY